MRRRAEGAGLLLAVAVLAGGIPAAWAAHGKDIDRLYAHGIDSERKGEYWQALRDAETVLRADPDWSDARQLRRTAGYEAHFRQALRLIDSSEWSKAARQLEEARVYKETAALAGSLELVRERLRQQESAHLAEPVTGYLDGVLRALRARDWEAADRNIRQAPAIPDVAPPVAHGELLGPLHAYATGHAVEAREQARSVALGSGDPAARSLLLFLNAGFRRREWPAAAGWAAGLYFPALLLSLYFGLRRELRRRAA